MPLPAGWLTLPHAVDVLLSGGGIAFVGWIWRVIRRPKVPAHPTSAAKTHITAPTANASAAVPPAPHVVAPSVEERIFVDVTPEHMTGLYDTHFTVHARRVIETYIGKWIKVSGPLGDVYPKQVVFAYGAYPGKSIYMYPGKGFIERCSVLPRGKHIEVIGRIREVGAFDVHLEDCELVT
jgi:hypothetical protein